MLQAFSLATPEILAKGSILSKKTANLSDTSAFFKVPQALKIEGNNDPSTVAPLLEF
jgi:hypothetical protein